MYSDEAFAGFYRRLRQKLMGMARRKFGLDEAAAEDVTQDAFCRLVAHQGAIHDYEAWLAVVLLNACRAFLQDHADEVHRRQALPPALPAPGDAVASLERLVLVSEIQTLLDERTQRMLRLHYLEGRTATEIAVLEGTTVRYVEKLIHQSLVAARRACNPPENVP